MSADDTTWLSGSGNSVGILSVALWLVAISGNPCFAQDAPAKPLGSLPVAATACQPPAVTALASGFTLLCGKRIPAGIFLGSYLSPLSDSIGDCLRRCTANDRCMAFSLDNRDPPASRVCTLYGSIETYADEQAWVSGFRAIGKPSTPTKTGSNNFNFDWPGNTTPNKTIIVSQPKDTGAWTDDSGYINNSVGTSAGGTLHRWGRVSSEFSKKFSEWTNKSVFFPQSTAPEPPKPSRQKEINAGDDQVTLTRDMKALQPVYFATDRTPAAGAPLETSFTAGRAANMSYGLAMVSIPKSHTIGNVERPKFRYFRWSYEPETDADHFRIKGLTPLDRDAFVGQLKGSADSVLLFIHGYNVPFADAMFKAAQIAFDANFAGTVLVFSWPSAGELFKYDQDRESAEFAVPHLAQIFRLLSDEVGEKKRVRRRPQYGQPDTRQCVATSRAKQG
jgi:hypothetical protein